MLGGEVAGTIELALVRERDGRIGAPAGRIRAVALEVFPPPTGIEQVVEAVTKTALGEPETAARLKDEGPGEHLGRRLDTACDTRECLVCRREMTLFSQRVEQGGERPGRAELGVHGELLLV